MIERYNQFTDAERKAFGLLIKKKRHSLDWKVDRLAQELSRCSRTVNYIESGSKPVNPKTIARLERLWPELIKKKVRLKGFLLGK